MPFGADSIRSCRHVVAIAVALSLAALFGLSGVQAQTLTSVLPPMETTPEPTALSFHASREQREQLLRLRKIVQSALVASGSGENTSFPYPGVGQDRRLWPVGKTAPDGPGYLPWWKMRGFFIASLVFGCLLFVALLLLCFFCSPMYPYCRRKCPCERPDDKEGTLTEKLAPFQDWLSSVGSSSSSTPGLSKDAAPDSTVPPYGVVRFATKYSADTSELAVTVKDCSDLPTNPAGRLDPCVTLRLGSKQQLQKLKTDSRAEDDGQSVTSEPVRGTTSPKFNFTGVFRAGVSDLAKLAVAIEVFDWSPNVKLNPMVARCVHDVAGAAEQTLSGELAFERQLARGQRIPDTGPGDVCLMLQQSQADGEAFKVKVIECKGVYLRDSAGKVDVATLPTTYVEVTLTEPQGRVHTRRTKTVAKDRNPYFNEEFEFPVSAAEDQLSGCSLRVTLVHVSDILRAKKPLASVVLSDDDHEDVKLAREHWLAVCQPPSGIKAPPGEQLGVSKCSWHYLVPPDEERRLWRARAMTAAAGGVAK